MTTKPPGWNIEEWEKQMNTTQTQPPQWAMEAAKEWYRMDGDGDRTHEMICGKLAAIISKHAPASNEQKLRASVEELLLYANGGPTNPAQRQAWGMLGMEGMKERARQALSTPAQPCERCEELVTHLQGVVQHIERGELVVRTLNNSALFPGCLGPSTVNQEATEYMAHELRAALAKHKEIV